MVGLAARAAETRGNGNAEAPRGIAQQVDPDASAPGARIASEEERAIARADDRQRAQAIGICARIFWSRDEAAAYGDAPARSLVLVRVLRLRERSRCGKEECYCGEALTLQTTFPTSSATSSAPRLSIATPTGRP